MRITARQLRQIIKEELSRSMYEADETSAAQTKVEPPPAEIPDILRTAKIVYTFEGGSFLPEVLNAIGPGNIVWTVKSGRARWGGWEKTGSDMIKSRHWFKAQMKKDSLGIAKMLDDKNGIPVDLPDGTYRVPAEASGDVNKLEILPKATTKVQESSRLRR